jgi:pyridoxamine 5'-phosphate oxidase
MEGERAMTGAREELAEQRARLQAAGLSRADLAASPVAMWRRWLSDAEDAGLPEPNAMVVSTVDPGGAPSSRTVLCKQADDDGFVFFTNHRSRKGVALAHEARVGLLFPWYALGRQVIVAGVATQVDRAVSEAYFATRPRGAQISATASEQSAVIPDRGSIEERVRALEVEFDGRDVPCPPHWGGFVVRPVRVEFWQGRADRLHDRLRYVASDSGWRVERLSP